MFIKKITLFAIICNISVIFVPNAWAGPAINVEQAQIIQQAFQTKLDELQRGIGDKIRFEGDLLIEPADTYYAVTLPHIYVDHKNGDIADFGIVALNLVPTAVLEKWMVSMALPTQISLKNKAGDILSKMTIGDQDFKGTWNTKLKWFETVQSTLGNLAFVDTKTKAVLNVEKISFNNNNEFGLGADKLNGIGQMAVHSISGKTPEDNTVFNINTLDMNYDISGFDFSYIDEIKKVFSAPAQEEVGEFDTRPAAQFDEMKTHIVVKDFKWSAKDNQDISIASLATKSSNAMREEGLMDSDTEINVSGMDVRISDELSPWLPTEFSSHVQLNNFPYATLTDWAKEQASIQKKNKDGATKTKLTIPPNMDAMKAAFVNAGTEYKINALKTKTKIGAGLDVTGQLVASEGAPYVATGNVNLGLVGLDLATAALQKKVSQLTTAQEGDAPKDILTPMIAQQGLMGIMMVQGFGKADQNADGQAVTRFDITLPREGGILINGQDIGALMGMMGAISQKDQK